LGTPREEDIMIKYSPYLAAAVMAVGCTNDDAILEVCTLDSEDVVAADDASLGFSAEDVVGLLDGRIWTVAWNTEDPDLTATSVDALTFTVSIGSDPILIRTQSSADAQVTCPEDGTYLWLPTAMYIGDEDGSMVVEGFQTLAVSSLQDIDVHFTVVDPLPITVLPDEFESAAEVKLGETEGVTFDVSITGDASTPNLFIEARSADVDSIVAIAEAELSA
jgi:hypothetical protein